MPPDFWSGNFCWPTGKREARKKGKMEQKRRKIKKGKGKMGGGKVTKWGEDLFFFAFHFKKPMIFWGDFLPGKSISRREKKIRKNDFAPSEKYSSYALADTLRYCNLLPVAVIYGMTKSVTWDVTFSFNKMSKCCLIHSHARIMFLKGIMFPHTTWFLKYPYKGNDTNQGISLLNTK